MTTRIGKYEVQSEIGHGAFGRVFRAYDSKYNIIDAQIANGSEPEVVIETLFQNPDTEFVDVRSVTHGCFTFRVQRA